MKSNIGTNNHVLEWKIVQQKKYYYYIKTIPFETYLRALFKLSDEEVNTKVFLNIMCKYEHTYISK